MEPQEDGKARDTKQYMKMLVERSRSVGTLTPSARSPSAHHELPADLSPRSSTSSLLSSNESLLNTSLSVPSPAAKESGSSPNGGISALQRLHFVLESNTLFNTYFSETENEHLEQQISKTFPTLGSPVGALTSPRMKVANGPQNEKMLGDHDDDHAPSPDEGEGEAMDLGNPLIACPTSTSNNNVVSQIFQCPLCAVVCNSRHDFNEHLVTHSQQHACPKCDFITNIEEEFRDHIQEIHGVEDSTEIFSDEEVKTPKTNAQGKLKTFKCKTCEHRSVTKKEFWDHAKSHIREEKMLHCPKCPFVTEYKHHLEYHLRNHVGSKPYQCNKCPYSCVNKSMLNSHLKSHSNVYQYRCSDCAYATKYCHSLKLHLRKYNHNPAMVLNPDGTPNPLPIIDVYGTRRGPKIKRPDPTLEGLATIQPAVSSPNKPIKIQKKPASTPVKKEKTVKQARQLDTRDISPKPASSPRFVSSMPNQSITPPLKKMKEDGSGDSDSDGRFHPLTYRLPNAQLPQAPISPNSIPMILQRNNGIDHHLRKDMGAFFQPSSNPLEFYAQYQYLLNPMIQMAAAAPLSGLAQQMAANEHQTKLLAQQMAVNEHQTKLLAHLLQTRIKPAQLKPEEMRNMSVADLLAKSGIANTELSDGIISSPLDLRKSDDGLNKRKRKGKALRYEQRFSDDEDSEDETKALDFSNNNNNAQENKEMKYQSRMVMYKH